MKNPFFKILPWRIQKIIAKNPKLFLYLKDFKILKILTISNRLTVFSKRI